MDRTTATASAFAEDISLTRRRSILLGDGELRVTCSRRIPGTEIIRRNTHAKSTQPRQNFVCTVLVLECDRFGDLELRFMIEAKCFDEKQCLVRWSGLGRNPLD
jgi:hypothetical protein